MPYIDPPARVPFKPYIMEILGCVPGNPVPSDPNERLLIKGDYFMFIINSFGKHLLNYEDIFYDLKCLPELQQLIDEQIYKVCQLVSSDLNKYGGEINYLISAIYWGLLGDHKFHKDAGYGLRSLYRSILELYLRKTELDVYCCCSSPKELIVFGVLHDVIDEAYHRKTTPYEDMKLNLNGDLWSQGSLL